MEVTIRKTLRSNRTLRDTPVLNSLLTRAVLFTALTFSASSQAADRLFDLTLSAQPSSVVSRASAVVGQVSFPSVLGDELQNGEVFDIALPTGTVVSGEVIMNSGSSPAQGTGEAFLTESTDSKVLRLGETEGSLEVHLIDNEIAGITLNDTENGRIYRSRINRNGIGDIAEIDANSILCSEMPKAPDEQVSEASLAKIPLGLTEAVVKKLQSRPGATNTVYIDSWGGVYEGGPWNGGSPIKYTPYSNDNDTTSFSKTDISYIWLSWAEMAEDYSDFDVNITTDTSVYEAASPATRSRIISTTSCAWYKNCGAGGVAYVNVFNRTDDYLKTGWTWNRSPGSNGMTHSHEAGHQMGLGHDGAGELGYYRGHGSWGPIMGAPFGKQYVQWSKGEYPNANNQQNDLSILASTLGLRPDDVGDAPASANELVATTGTIYSITPNGITVDKDVFALTVDTPQEVSIDVEPTLAHFGEARAANAAFNVTFADSAGTVIEAITSSDNTPLRPNTNTFSHKSVLPKGIYYLTVNAISPDRNWTTGFGGYGHGGEYRLTVDIKAGPDPEPEPSDPGMVTPVARATLAGFTDTFNWISNGTDVSQYWIYVGSSPGNNDHDNSGSLSPSTLSYSSSTLPIDGSNVYVTLYWLEAGSNEWKSTGYTYTSFSGKGLAFTSPESGGVLAGVSDNFEWTDNDSGATEYWLYLGSEVGALDYYNSGLLGNANSKMVQSMAADGGDLVNLLPTDGSTVYARLWYRATSFNNWQFIDDTFTAATGGSPSIISPVPEGLVSSSSTTLTWEPGEAAVSEWWIYVGTGVGANDVYNSGSLGSSVSASVSTPTEDGATAHVTLWFKINGIWRTANYVYTVSSDT